MVRLGAQALFFDVFFGIAHRLRKEVVEEQFNREAKEGWRFVTERMSQGEKVKHPKEKKKVPGWSIEEMKERPDIAVEEDTEEIKRWRSPNQSEMDLCWKSLAERMEEEVLDKYKVEKSERGALQRRGNPLEWRRVRRNKKYKN